MSRLEAVGREHKAYFSAAELMGTAFPEPRWAVPGLVAEGLTLFAGAPKLGKSWLVLSLGLSTAGGAPALGKIPSAPGSVLYCALEDTPRRLKSRLVKMLQGEPAPDDLTIVTALPQMPQAVELVSEWLDDHPDARLVIVDVLGKIRPPDGERANAYERDYAVMGQLKRLADSHRVAVVVVTHTRKMGADDAFDTVSGSTGLTGAADTTLVLRRGRGESSAVLHVTGRDVEESEYALTFEPSTGSWTLDGNALAEAAARADTMRATAGLGDTAAKVIELVNASPDGLRAADVAQQLDIEPDTARQYLKRASDRGRIAKRDRGLYMGVTTVTSVTPPGNPEPERDRRDTSDSALQEESTAGGPLCRVCMHPMSHESYRRDRGVHMTCKGGAQ